MGQKISQIHEKANPEKNPEIKVLIDTVSSGLRRVFDIYDNDLSGSISFSEWSGLQSAVAALSDERTSSAGDLKKARETFAAKDTNNDGKISFEEFQGDFFKRCFFDKADRDRKNQAPEDIKDGKENTQHFHLNPDKDAWRAGTLTNMVLTVKNAYKQLEKAEINPLDDPVLQGLYERTLAAINRVFKLKDVDHTGYISLDEWTSIYVKLNNSADVKESLKAIKAQFAARDTNKDNIISAGEFETDVIRRYWLKPAGERFKAKQEIDVAWRLATITQMLQEFETLAREVGLLVLYDRANPNKSEAVKKSIDTVNIAIERIHELYDNDNSGFVTLDEWTRIYVGLHAGNPDSKDVKVADVERRAMEVFKEKDADRNGKLTLEESKDDMYKRIFFDVADRDKETTNIDDIWRLKTLHNMLCVLSLALIQLEEVEANPDANSEVDAAHKEAVKAITLAFKKLDPEDQGYLTFDQWSEVHAKLRPDSKDSVAAARAVFEARDLEKAGIITVGEFVSDVLRRYFFKAAKTGTADAAWRVATFQALAKEFAA